MKLSPKFLAVARLICDGKSNDEIGVELGITASCAKWRTRDLMNRLGARDRANIAARIAASGLWQLAPGQEVVADEPREAAPRRAAKGKRKSADVNLIESAPLPRVTISELAAEGVFEVGAVAGTQIAYVVTEERTVIIHKDTINEALRAGWRERIGTLKPTTPAIRNVHPADRGEIYPGRESARALIQSARP